MKRQPSTNSKSLEGGFKIQLPDMGVLVNESENRRFLSAGFSPPSVYKLTPSISKGLGRVVKNTSA